MLKQHHLPLPPPQVPTVKAGPRNVTMRQPGSFSHRLESTTSLKSTWGDPPPQALSGLPSQACPLVGGTLDRRLSGSPQGF